MKKLKMARGVTLTFEEGCNKYLENCRQRNLREVCRGNLFGEKRFPLSCDRFAQQNPRAVGEGSARQYPLPKAFYKGLNKVNWKRNSGFQKNNKIGHITGKCLAVCPILTFFQEKYAYTRRFSPKP